MGWVGLESPAPWKVTDKLLAGPLAQLVNADYSIAAVGLHMPLAAAAALAACGMLV